MPRTTCPFLTVSFRFRHTDFAPRLGLVRSLTGIRHLAYKRLMHESRIDLDFKNIGGQINLLYLLAAHIHY
jgi:hypothetical protein